MSLSLRTFLVLALATASLALPQAASAAVELNITESGGSTETVEGGGTDTVEISLGEEPAANVEVTLTPDLQVSSNEPFLTFTVGDWNVPQQVEVSAIDDAIAEGPHTGDISFSVTSADPNWNGLFVAPIIVSVVDNDAAGVVITETGGATIVSEDGVTDDYLVVLATEPIGGVEIAILPDSELLTGTPTLDFDNTNWNTPQVVSVSAVDDGDTEGAHTGTIQHQVTSPDINYDGAAVDDVVVSIADNDSAAGVTITESGGSTDVTEGGASDSYTVVLDSQPTDDVTVDVQPDTQVEADVPSLTFTNANWATPQLVEVEAEDDDMHEASPHDAFIEHTVTSEDASYEGQDPQLFVSVTDNDLVDFAIIESDGSTEVSEDGIGDSYEIALTSQPAADVVVTISPDSELQVDTPEATFTSANWNVPVTVTVNAIDDGDIEGNHSGTITHTLDSLDLDYHQLNVGDVNADILDNDAASIDVVETDGTTEAVEGGSGDTFLVEMAAAPTDDVVVTLTPDSQVEVHPDAVVLEFGPDDWDEPRFVDIEAVDDDTDEGGNHEGIVQLAAESDDANYDEFAIGDVSVDIIDNDGAPLPAPDSQLEEISGEDMGKDAIRKGSTVYINNGVGSQLTITISTSIDESGWIESVQFPDLGPGWSAGATVTESFDGAGGYRHTYTWTAGAEPPGSINATVLSRFGTTDVVEVRILTDQTPPGTGSLKTPKASRQIMGARSLTIRWARGADGQSGAVATDVRMKSRDHNDRTWGPLKTWANDVAGTSKKLNGGFGHTYCFQIRTRDRFGNRSGWSAQRCAVIPLNSNAARHSGFEKGGKGPRWKHVSKASHFGGSAASTTGKGAILKFPKVRGAKLELIVARCSRCGKLRVEVEGKRARTIDLRAGKTRYRQRVTIYTGSASKARTVRIVSLKRGKQHRVEGLVVSP